MSNEVSAMLKISVKEIMKSPVLFINSEWRLSDAASFFLEHSVSGAPVLDDQGKTIGVLTLKDIARYTMWHLEVEEYEEDLGGSKKSTGVDQVSLPQNYKLDKMTCTTVRQVMSVGVITVSDEVTISKILGVMMKNRIHRVFVKKAGKIIGVVTTMDIIRWLRCLDIKEQL
ncbi:MAG: CBS domain-containing protein [Planctomycetes bacterium]|nr:CBS domain-containing protein [Planctomycetota bacterium]